MEQPTHPAIGHRRDHHTGRLSTMAEPSSQGRPPLLTADQAMGRFDQQGSQFVVAGLDQSRVRLPLAAGGIPWTQAAEASQLFAGPKAIKASNLGPQGRGRDQTDAFDVNSFWTRVSSRV